MHLSKIVFEDYNDVGNSLRTTQSPCFRSCTGRSRCGSSSAVSCVRCSFILLLKSHMSLSRPRRVNPLIPLVCIGVILFLIAATIVIALIPVYVDRRLSPADTGPALLPSLQSLHNISLPSSLQITCPSPFSTASTMELCQSVI